MVKVKNIILLVVSCFIFVSSKEDDAGRVIGGSHAALGQFPHQVAILNNGAKWCGGSIPLQTNYSAPKIILTAAHCTQGQNVKSLTIVAGSNDLTTNIGVRIPAFSFLVHQQYNSKIWDYDISLVFLTQPLQYSANIRPIVLADANDVIYENQMATVSGFGGQNEQKTSDSKLKYAQVVLNALAYCQAAIPMVTSRMICAGFAHGKINTCSGDSGGPLVVNNKLFGITSWGYGCGEPNRPSVFASVPALRSWIQQNAVV